MKNVILNMRADRTGGEQPLRTHNHATLSSHLKATSDRPELAAEPLRLMSSCPLFPWPLLEEAVRWCVQPGFPGQRRCYRRPPQSGEQSRQPSKLGVHSRPTWACTESEWRGHGRQGEDLEGLQECVNFLRAV